MSLDYLNEGKSFNKELFYTIGGVLILIAIFGVYYFSKPNNKPAVSNNQDETSMSRDQKLSILQTLNQTSDKSKQLSETAKLNLLKSLH